MQGCPETRSARPRLVQVRGALAALESRSARCAGEQKHGTRDRKQRNTTPLSPPPLACYSSFSPTVRSYSYVFPAVECYSIVRGQKRTSSGAAPGPTVCGEGSGSDAHASSCAHACSPSEYQGNSAAHQMRTQPRTDARSHARTPRPSEYKRNNGASATPACDQVARACGPVSASRKGPQTKGVCQPVGKGHKPRACVSQSHGTSTDLRLPGRRVPSRIRDNRGRLACQCLLLQCWVSKRRATCLP